MRPSRLFALALGSLLVLGSARADEVTKWDEILLDTIRATGGPPCPIARAGAMMHVAVYEAVNSIDRTHEPYLALVPAAPGASPAAAAAAAAHRVLSALYPQRADIYDAALAASLASVANSTARDNGVAVGVAAADAIMAARADDGTAVDPPYAYGNEPGDYRPTPPDFHEPPFNTGWGLSKPWSMITGADFRPPPPMHAPSMAALLASPGYAAVFDDVKALGERSSEARTAEQTEIAWFWANDRNGTYKPPGHLNHIAHVVSDQRQLTLAENARLFALVNVAMADSGLVAWDAKYDTEFDLWRPVSGIRLAADDGNDATEPDPNWLPLLDFTPPFPAYISGHATFGAAHAAVMADFFGTDDVTFTTNTDEPGYQNVYRTFHSFSEAAHENGRSRIYLGVHWQFDADEGFNAGTALGHHVFATMLRPIEDRCTAGDFFPEGHGDGRVTLADFITAVRTVMHLQRDEPVDACADLWPGQVTCRPPHAPAKWCVQGDGQLALADVLVLRRILGRRLVTSCDSCYGQEAPIDRRLPGDLTHDGAVDVRDVIRALRASVALDELDGETTLRADVSPRAANTGDVAGDGRVDVADVVTLLRASVGLAELRWPERALTVQLGVPVTSTGWTVSVAGLPDWAACTGADVTGCDGPADGSELDGSTWSATCVSDPRADVISGDLVRFRYRGAAPVDPATLDVQSEIVDAGLATIDAPVTVSTR